MSGTFYVAGLTTVNYGMIKNCSASGTISGWKKAGILYEDSFGGMVAVNWGTMEDCSSSSDVNGFTLVGGLLGNETGAGANIYLKNSYATGNVYGTNSIGGLVGGSIHDINNSYATGNVTLACNNPIGECDAGGLIGYLSGIVYRSYATGNVSEINSHIYSNYGSSGIGGLVGSGNAGRIIDSFSTGDVNGINRVGGLAGHIATYDGDTNPRVVNSFSTGKVTFNQGTELHSGRILGELTSYPTGASITALTSGYIYLAPLTNITSCYHNFHNGAAFACVPTTITDSNSGSWGSGKQYFQGSEVATRQPMASWSDFGNNWTAVAGEYPKLKWQD
ncbi:MAG: hypothetical protein AABW59_04640 [archaeon]